MRIRFVLALLVLSALRAFALDPSTALTQFMRDHWQAEQGLPQNSVTAILQTRDGYFWLGTQEGLVRFDGVRFTLFDTRNTPELGHNFVLCLYQDRHGHLYIGTYGGLTRFENGRFRQIAKGQVRAVVEDQRGKLWIGTLGAGVIGEPSIPGKRVRAIVEDRDAIWIGTEEGVTRWKDGAIAQRLPNLDVRALWLDARGVLWIGTDGAGLYRYENGSLQKIGGLANDVVRALYGDRDGSLWISAWGGGLHRLHDNKLEHLGTADGLTSDQIWTFFEDREGSLWIGTDAGGVVRLKKGKLTALTTREGLTNDVVLALVEDRDGSVWMGTYGGGVDHLKDGVITKLAGLPNDTVQCLRIAHDGALLIGTSGGGVARYANGKLTQLTKDDFARVILEDRAGNIWIGTDGAGLKRIDPRRGGLQPPEPPGFGRPQAAPTSDVVLSLLEDRNGTIWIGTDGGGLDRLDGDKITAIKTHDIVSALHEDRDGTLWIGTSGGGLSRLKNGKLATITSKQGLADDTVFTIVDDDAGNFWMTSNKGIFRAARRDIEDVLDGKRARLTSVAYGVADGMKSAECNAGAPAGLRTRDGRLWFPTIRGVVIADPRHMETNRVVPPVVIERALADGQAVDVSHPLQLRPGTHTLELQYTALSFRAPERVHFKYKLEGFDDDWVDAGTRRTAYYTNLPHGEYRFRVRASNDDGVWNDTGSTLAMTVAPKLIETPWFRTLIAIAILAAIYGLYRARIWRLHARERELVAIVEERTKSLRVALTTAEEANRAKSVFLANMSHELRTPLNAVLGFTQLLARDRSIAGENREGVTIIQRSGEHLLGLINDVLSISKIEAGRLSLDERPFDLGELLQSVVAMMRERAESKAIDVHFEIDGTLPRGVLGDAGKLRQVLI
ncbi:MAG TPA: two-component regulator propeller domain-containing protein, partial [Thermoanaerobaculia bacterium]|nr:two-component regulator propeller domain-containing protein [Thermoanaerobaculia bacterium]